MPNLIVIAGCNGAGKSTFASSFLPEGMTSFDYDRIFLENYNCLFDSELREDIARNQTIRDFELSIDKALNDQADFCYETNFDSHPLIWPELFKINGYQINLIFFCLENQDIARHRIQVRAEFQGHFVDDKTVDLKWKAGYKHVNQHFQFFDNLLFVDNSKQNDVYTNILQIEKSNFVLMMENLPEYFKSRLPDIYALINPK
ncbi:zeta toxin family protein [Cyclobacterium sp. SYSU L10401]|uniref:zeta toxin family protein n=1 Tax=Cyclobacterium sp. SYSU L10401 TaxID=2678657 RepID=UPI0013D315A6|nr:zeta toxin family protein [Cyclobacterium sp. SYSU L10401]